MYICVYSALRESKVVNPHIDFVSVLQSMNSVYEKSKKSIQHI
jgi:hypothetical protein